MHTEAKQTETPESGAEKGVLQALHGDEVASALKSLELPGFRQSIFKGRARKGAGGGVVAGYAIRSCTIF